MIKNRTQIYKQRYSNSSKKQQTFRAQKQQSFNSSATIKFQSEQILKKTKSTPKLQNSSKMLFRTQPLITSSKNRSKKTENQYTLYSSNQTEVETIQTLMKRRGVDEKQIESLKQGKLKKTSKSKLMSRDSEEFIEKIAKNSLFFCCSCFQYVFQIEKHRHFPICKDQINPSDPNKNLIVLKRLQQISELSIYSETNVEQISQLYGQFVHGQYKKLSELYYPNFDFFTLKEITYSFAYTYLNLAKDVKYVNDVSFFNCF